MILNVLSNFLVEEAGGKALPLILDVRDEQQVKSVVQNAVDKVIIALDFFREFFLVPILLVQPIFWYRDHGRKKSPRSDSEQYHHPANRYLVICCFFNIRDESMDFDY